MEEVLSGNAGDFLPSCYKVAYLIVFSEPEIVDSFCESVKQFRNETTTFQAPETKHRTGQKTQSSRPL
jgi:hypothetical protein